MIEEENVSVILSGYKRPHTLKEQFTAIKRQSVEIEDIYFWQNNPEINFDPNIVSLCKSFIGNTNLGVWARFAFALNCKTKYICIFDDDTIPGINFIKNCIESNKIKPGLYGTIGLIYKSRETYLGAQRYGWDGINNTNIQQVDIVGHAWFFERKLLSYFWQELPDKNDFYVGEDMHFSHMIQKYAPQYGTYVPPHPIDDKSLWGSLKGFEYGGDHLATANFAVPLMDEYFKKIISKGFNTINK